MVNVPRVVGQGACAETAFVVDKTGDSHFDDLLWKPSDKGRGRRRSLRGSATGTHSADSGPTLVPYSHNK